MGSVLNNRIESNRIESPMLNRIRFRIRFRTDLESVAGEITDCGDYRQSMYVQGSATSLLQRIAVVCAIIKGLL